MLGALAAGGVLVAGLAAALFFLHKGPRRAALVAWALPLAVVLPCLAVSYSSFSMIQAFAAAAAGHGGSVAAIAHQLQQSWMVVRAGAAVAAAVSVVGLVLGLVPAPSRVDAPGCSARRGLVLLLLPLCALLSVAAVASPLRSALRVTSAVIATPADEESRRASDRLLEDAGLGGSGAGAMARTSDYIARRATTAAVGALVVAVILLGLAATALPLALPVRVGGVFASLAALLWLAALGLATAVAMGAGDPARMG